ncbi:tetratricopeptide repeat protein [Alkalicaulis satelles]|uniref:Tetratricopeptide repeat protein n=1 Tax=Alkalicaulis satelles TaxID=2609175 RepID=A0A5M6ZA89_9PROT|nr:tetratricopeptide repeat protein [Alkalicaulis satelles]KAA5801613.1 tetratricopeptide repeat protein [Alkalicaulis satelles]
MTTPARSPLRPITMAMAAGALCAAASASALAQAHQASDPALDSARAECESAAHASAPPARALGACDLVLRAPGQTSSARARALTNRGVIALKRNNVGPAHEDLEQAVQYDPDLASAWLSLSAARIRAGDSTGAIEAAREAGERGADRSLVTFNTAIALERAGRYDEAYEAYAEAARLDPDNALLAAQPARFTRHQGAS